jgi:hypothetical protein
MKPNKEEKRRFWQDKVALFERSGQKPTTFCREQGLSTHALFYWRRRLKEQQVIPSFVQLAVRQDSISGPQQLPDPKWLAEFIGHLMG